MSMAKLARPEVQQLKPYRSARMEAQSARVALDANECPWPLFGDEALQLNRYPQPQSPELIAAMAEAFGVPAMRLMLSRGSDEGIDLLTRAFCRPGLDTIVQCSPCFGMYAVAAAIQGVTVRSVPLLPDTFALDVSGVISAAQNARIVFLCSPNNPTGNSLDMDDVFAVVQALTDRCLVVIDQAYAEFAPGSSLAAFAGQVENLVVLRTLSKAYGLAGLRCGCVVADPSVIEILRRIMPPYPLSTPSISMALEALSPANRELWGQSINRILGLRVRLIERLNSLEFVDRVWPSAANFVLARFNDGDGFYAYAKERGVVVRNVSKQPGLTNCLRISVGAEPDLQALDEVFETYQGVS